MPWTRRLAWQIDERLRVSVLMFRILAANERHRRVVERRQVFGPDRLHQQVRLFIPPGPADCRPLLVYFLHGGGWGHGHPGLFRFVGHFFAERGYPTLVGGYRLAPEHRFPAQIDDVQAGLAAGLSLAAGCGLPTGQLVLAGQSAGAQLAALLAFDRDRRPEGVQGLALMSGLLSFALCRTRKDRRMLRNYLGRPGTWGRADPIRFVQGDESFPVLCIHGERDLLVDPANSRAMVNRLNMDGIPNGELCLVPRGYHTDLTALFLDRLPAGNCLSDWLEGLCATTKETI